MKRFAFVLSLSLLFAASAFADIPKPEKPKAGPSIDTNLDIRLVKDAKEARLIIPWSQLNQLRAALDGLDSSADIASATKRSPLAIQTIVGGAFLSLAFVFGGLWFVRSRKPGGEQGKVVVALVIGIAFCSGAVLVWANAGPPSEARSISGKMFAQGVHMYGFGYGHVKLEVSDSDRLQLIVPDPPDAKPTPAE
jgi:hypothetical protein